MPKLLERLGNNVVIKGGASHFFFIRATCI